MICGYDRDEVVKYTTLLEKETNIQVVGTDSNLMSPLTSDCQLGADVVVICSGDSSPVNNSVAVIRQICESVNSSVVLVSENHDDTFVREGFAAGATYILRSEDDQILPNLLGSINDDSLPQRVLVADYNKQLREDKLRTLTRAERDIFHLMEQGYSRREMAEVLFKSLNTVNTQIRQILIKLNAKSSKDAVAMLRSGTGKNRIMKGLQT